MPRACRFCGHSFDRREELKQHVSTEHPAPKKKCKCDPCGREFVDRAALRRHLQESKRHQKPTVEKPNSAEPRQLPSPPPSHVPAPPSQNHDEFPISMDTGTAWLPPHVLVEGGVIASEPTSRQSTPTSDASFPPESPGPWRYPKDGPRILAYSTNTPTEKGMDWQHEKANRHGYCRNNAPLALPDQVAERLALSAPRPTLVPEEPTQDPNGKCSTNSSCKILSHSTIFEDGFEYMGNTWSIMPVEQRAAASKPLVRRCHRISALHDNRYILWPRYTLEFAYHGWRRCSRCSISSKHTDKKKGKECRFHIGKLAWNAELGRRVFNCCKKPEPCTIRMSHDFEAADKRLRTVLESHISLPEPDKTKPKRVAVVIDCEMVAVNMGYSELARISAVDYFSGETLVDRFVEPEERVVDWRTPYSGVTAQILAKAKASGEIFNGLKEAREALLEHIDDDTILIGHTMNNDLDALRITSHRIVDIHILLKDAASRQTPGLGLQGATKQFLAKDVQNHGKRGHDSLEDALATREVLLWCMDRPQELRDWGRKVWLEEQRQKKIKQMKDMAKSLTMKLEGVQKRREQELNERGWE